MVKKNTFDFQGRRCVGQQGSLLNRTFFIKCINLLYIYIGVIPINNFAKREIIKFAQKEGRIPVVQDFPNFMKRGTEVI